MTEENQTTPDQTEVLDGPTEAEIKKALKAKADLLGVTYSNNITIDQLRKKIAEAQADPEVEETDETENEAPKALTSAEIRAKQKAEQLRLVRVRIANMNPSKASLGGEIVTVRTKYLGIIKKFVPFGEATDEGFHLPFILYTELKNRKFLQTKVKKEKNGQQMLPVSRWVPEFSLEVMPDLTPEELQRLANQQAAAAGMAD
jgi:hypothetical protein